MGRVGRIGLVLAMMAAAAPAALAAMGASAVMEGMHLKTKGKMTMDEARDAAAASYDKIKKANGGKVTLLQFGGRVLPNDLKAAKIGDGERDEDISKADYLALASRFFAEANVSRKSDVSPADGTLSEGELSTPAGEKLMRLIE